MAEFPGYSIRVRRSNDDHDVTNYTLGFSSSANFGFGRPAHLRTEISLNNNNGDFTPADGGGTGTFKDVLWYESYVEIVVYGTSTTVFEGLVSQFTIQDNGRESRATLVAVDWMTLTRSDVFSVSELVGTTAGQTPAWHMYSFFNGSTGYGNGATTPKLGYQTAVYSFDQADDIGLDMGRPAMQDVTVLDAVQKAYIAPLPCVVLPNEIKQISSIYVGFYADVLGRSITYSDNVEYVFTENPTGSELPFTAVAPNFDRNMITSRAHYESAMSGVGTASSLRGLTESRYGERDRKFTETAHMVSSGDTENEYGMIESARFWIDRQAEARYVPRQLRTTIETVETHNDSTAALDQVEELLSIKHGFWHPVQVTYTPTGGSEVTANCVISGRTINATPAQTTIILDLLPAIDYQSFRLDSTVIGSLDYNRLA